MCGVRDFGMCSPGCDVFIMLLPLRLRAGLGADVEEGEKECKETRL